MLGVVVSNSKIPSNKENLTANEESWMQSLNAKVVSTVAASKLEKWEIRMDKSQFEN